MNVLVNLLPDTRQVKQRDARRRQLATGIAIALWVICGGLVVLLFLYNTSQRLIVGSLTSSIAGKEKQLQGTTGLTDALTAQQHLASLPTLYGQRTYFTNFLNAYAEANPTDITLSSLAVDASNALVVNGQGKSYAAVAKLAKALEAEHVTVGQNASQGNQPYFTNVSIQTVARTNNQVGFTINATLSGGVTSGN
jgi:hypothetical protein